MTTAIVTAPQGGQLGQGASPEVTIYIRRGQQVFQSTSIGTLSHPATVETMLSEDLDRFKDAWRELAER